METLSIFVLKIIGMNTSEILSIVKKIRKEKGFSQEVIAEKLGITQRMYGRLENEESEVTLNQLFKIMEILDISLNDILNIQKQEGEDNTNEIVQKLNDVLMLLNKK